MYDIQNIVSENHGIMANVAGLRNVRVAAEIERFNTLIKTAVSPNSGYDNGIEKGYTFNQALKMLRVCPPARIANSVITNFIQTEFTGYKHNKEDISNFVNKQLKNMRGSFSKAIAESTTAFAMGHTVSEIVMKKWELDTVFILNPNRYDLVGSSGELKAVRYYPMNGEHKDMSLEKVMIITNSQEISYGSPFGVGAVESAYPTYNAWVIVLGEMLHATTTQSGGSIYMKVQSDVPVPVIKDDGTVEMYVDEDGLERERTIPAVVAAEQQLTKLRNGGIVATDLTNEIGSFVALSDPEFWDTYIRIIEKMIFQAWLMPDTVLSTGGSGSGDSNLNKGHMQIMINNTRSLAKQIKEAWIESVVTPLIIWNFGEQDDYGVFPEPQDTESDRVELIRALLMKADETLFAKDGDLLKKRVFDLAGIR